MAEAGSNSPSEFHFQDVRVTLCREEVSRIGEDFIKNLKLKVSGLLIEHGSSRSSGSVDLVASVSVLAEVEKCISQHFNTKYSDSRSSETSARLSGLDKGRQTEATRDPDIGAQQDYHRQTGDVKMDEQLDGTTGFDIAKDASVRPKEPPSKTYSDSGAGLVKDENKRQVAAHDLSTDSEKMGNGHVASPTEKEPSATHTVDLIPWLWAQRKYSNNMKVTFKKLKVEIKTRREEDTMVLVVRPLTGEELHHRQIAEVINQLESYAGMTGMKNLCHLEVPPGIIDEGNINNIRDNIEDSTTFLCSDGHGTYFIVGMNEWKISAAHEFLTQLERTSKSSILSSMEPTSQDILRGTSGDIFGDPTKRSRDQSGPDMLGSYEKLSQEDVTIKSDEHTRMKSPRKLMTKHKEAVPVDMDIWKYVSTTRNDELTGIFHDHKKAEVKPEKSGSDCITLNVEGPKDVVQSLVGDLVLLIDEESKTAGMETVDISKTTKSSDERKKGIRKLSEDHPKFIVWKRLKTDIRYRVIGPKSAMRHVLPLAYDALGVKYKRRRALTEKERTAPSSSSPPPEPGRSSYATTPADPSSILSRSMNEKTRGLTFNYRDWNKVHIFQGDITKLCVSVIVNAANEWLNNAAGVAGAISKAAGPEFDRDCQAFINRHGLIKIADPVITKGYRLNATHVIHVVGPRWYDFKDKRQCMAFLNAAFFNCLKLAETMKFSSIAIPAVSSGIFGVPCNAVANILYEAVMYFLGTYPTYVKDIILIDINSDLVDLMQLDFKRVSSDTRSPLKLVSPPDYSRFIADPSLARQHIMQSGFSEDAAMMSLPVSSNDASSSRGHSTRSSRHMTDAPDMTHRASSPIGGTRSSHRGSDTHRSTRSRTPPFPIDTGSTLRNPDMTTYGTGFRRAESSLHGRSGDPVAGLSSQLSGLDLSVDDRGTDRGAAGSGETTAKSDDNCCICMSSPDDPVTLGCKHSFCKDCIEGWFKQKPTCPSCGMLFGEMKGNQPDGTMRDDKTRNTLPGHYGDSSGTIVITYTFHGGVQGSNHPNPGRRYHGTSRTGYLPDNREGREVLGLLRRAFDAKLVFTIGRSTTTGAEDQITWNDIHHKTNMRGGPDRYGYPDPTYLARVKAELADKGIKS